MSKPRVTPEPVLRPGGSTTRLLLGLQWRLWKRTVSGNPAIAITAMGAGLYALIGLIAGSVLTAQAIASGPATLMAAVVGAGVVGYLMLALFLPSGEGQLRPDSFTTLPVAARDLIPAMAIATMMQTRGVIAAVCTLVTMVVAVVAAVVGGAAWLIPVIIPTLLLALMTALLLGDVLATLIGSGGRVSRERAGVFGVLVFLVVVVGYSLLSSSGIGLEQIELGGRILSWTPFGATGGVIAAVADSRWLIAVAQLAIAVGTVAVVMWWWRSRVDRELHAPLDTGSSAAGNKTATGDQRRLTLPGVSFTPVGVVFSRAVRYLRRDSRLLPSVLMIPALGAFFLIQGVIGEEPSIYFGALFLALLAGSLASNDFGYDGPAGWLHLVSGIPPRTQLLARHAAAAVPMLLAVLLYVIVMVFIAPDAGIALLVGVGAVGMLGTSLGLALTLTTFNAYPTSPPGTNPWSDKSGFSGAAFLAAFVSILLGWIPSVPGMALMITGYTAGTPLVVAAGVLLALLLPGALYAAAVVACGRRVNRHRIEIHHKVRNWVN